MKATLIFPNIHRSLCIALHKDFILIYQQKINMLLLIMWMNILYFTNNSIVLFLFILLFFLSWNKKKHDSASSSIKIQLKNKYWIELPTKMRATGYSLAQKVEQRFFIHIYINDFKGIHELAKLVCLDILFLLGQAKRKIRCYVNKELNIICCIQNACIGMLSDIHITQFFATKVICKINIADTFNLLLLIPNYAIEHC